MAATEQRTTPPAREGTGEKRDRIRRTPCGPIEQELLRGFGAWTPRQQVDDATHRAGAIQRRGHTFDDLDLSQIHRRDLEQTEPADLAKQRQPVREHARIAASHALNAHAGGAEGRRRRLHPHAAHLVQHHDDVTGRHEHLLFDFLAREDLDAHRLILETLVGPCRCDDGDAFLEVRLRLQLHDDLLRRAGAHLHGCGHGHESGLHDGDVDVAGAGDNGRRTGRVGAMAGASDDHFRVLDRLLRRTDLNTNGARLALGGHGELTHRQEHLSRTSANA